MNPIIEELNSSIRLEDICGGTFATADVTPEMARKLLSLSGGNRPISKSLVSKYAKHMSQGTWDTSMPTQFIMFDKAEVLINGHHTLNAVIKSGETIKLWFMFNTPRSFYIDGGRSRSEADRYVMTTGGNRATAASYKRAVAVCNILKVYTGMDLTTEEQRREFITEHLQDFDFINDLHCKPGSLGLSTAPLFAAVYLAKAYGGSHARLQHFWEVLQSGFSVEQDDRIIIKLRDWLRTQAPQSKTNEYKRTVLYTVMDVLDKWLSGLPIKKIEVPETFRWSAKRPSEAIKSAQAIPSHEDGIATAAAAILQ